MATKRADIHKAFLRKISDYELPQLSEALESEFLNGYLESAIARSWRSLKHIDFSKSDELKFEDDFDLDAIDILSEWMVMFWLEPFINNSDNLKLNLNTKDFNTISPANLLEKMSNRYELCRKHAISLMNKYSFMISELERLTP